jgi:hypothetical protein
MIVNQLIRSRDKVRDDIIKLIVQLINIKDSIPGPGYAISSDYLHRSNPERAPRS